MISPQTPSIPLFVASTQTVRLAHDEQTLGGIGSLGPWRRATRSTWGLHKERDHSYSSIAIIMIQYIAYIAQ